MKTLLIALLAALAAGVLASSAAAATGEFRSPSGNIRCGAIWATRSSVPAQINCDVIRHSWRPTPKPRGCRLFWGQPGMLAKGRPHFRCVGGAASTGREPVLRYGKTRRLGPFVCASRRTGITCRNRGRHGFFLFKQRYRFF